MNELTTINKLKQAQLTIREVKTLDEIKQLIDQSEALKGYAKAQRLSKEMQDDITEYHLYATRQMGLISAALEKAKANQYTKVESPPNGLSKKETLTNAGISKQRANEAEKLAKISEERFTAIIAKKRNNNELTKTAVMQEIKTPHITYNSGNNEWYTPKEYIDAARAVMGDIDYDPASSDTAQEIVQARTYSTLKTDGLKSEWYGRIWMNPPYSAELLPLFVHKLCVEYCCERVIESIILVNNATEIVWFNKLIICASAVVFPKSRIKFYMPDGKTGTPLQGQAVIYIGKNPKVFMEKFRPFGWGAFI